jgi:hypothetical protein
VAVWEELRAVLARLADERPGELIQYPAPEADEGRQPPFTITLAPSAVATAEELHRQFGADVELTVGALPYPPGREPWRAPAPAQALPDLLDRQEITAELDGPAVVSSGQALRHGLLLLNHTDRELRLSTNGQVTATVVDPQDESVVGGFAGFQAEPLASIPGSDTRCRPVNGDCGRFSSSGRTRRTRPAGVHRCCR